MLLWKPNVKYGVPTWLDNPGNPTSKRTHPEEKDIVLNGFVSGFVGFQLGCGYLVGFVSSGSEEFVRLFMSLC